MVELLVVIGIIIILMSLLLPAIGSIRARSRQTECASKQREIALALQRVDADRGLFKPHLARAWRLHGAGLKLHHLGGAYRLERD